MPMEKFNSFFLAFLWQTGQVIVSRRSIIYKPVSCETKPLVKTFIHVLVA